MESKGVSERSMGVRPSSWRVLALIAAFSLLVAGYSTVRAKRGNTVQFFAAQVTIVEGTGAGVCLTTQLQADPSGPARCYANRLSPSPIDGSLNAGQLRVGDIIRVGVVEFRGEDGSGELLLVHAVPSPG